MILRAKYRFGLYPKLFMTTTSELWQEGYMIKNKCYGYRQLKEKYHQGQLKFVINGKWVSKKKLNECAYLVEQNIDNLQIPERYMPFNLKIN
jgi:hypothetical protein